jgi:competence protein ComEA
MHGDSEPVAARTASLAPGSSAPVVPSTSTSPSAAAGSVTVDVSGKVRHPGVATLPSGSRVVDALRRAGGARSGVDLSSLNLARVLVDGEQILVGRGAPGGGIAAGASTSAPDPSSTLVNLNTATEEQLDTLPGVGPVTAQKILDWRSAHGAFSSVDELLEVDGIGEKTLADLAPLVTL